MIEVAEKSPISNRANVGAYGFASAALLRDHIARMLDATHRQAMHYFVSTIITAMLREGHQFVGVAAEDTALCGTPPKLEEFIDKVSAGAALKTPKRRFSFALDNVLVTAPERPGDFGSVKPIERNVQLVRELKASGHHIIITTSRLMEERSGNVGAVIAQCGHSTLQTLAALEIPYDEIHFGQPHADLYVDRSVACASTDTEKDIGWRLRRDEGSKLEPGMIAARHFNTLTLEGENVIKTAASAVLRGEIFFYVHMPTDIAELFPTLIAHYDRAEDQSPLGSPRLPPSPRAVSFGTAAADNGGAPSLAFPPADERAVGAAAAPADAQRRASSGEASPPRSSDARSASGRGVSIASLTLSRVQGVTFSHLITSRCLTPGRLTMLLKALRRVHSSAGDAASRRPANELDVCANYLPKLRRRYAAHRALYASLNGASDQMFDELESVLGSFASERRYALCNVVHGDPVFSNVLLTDEPRIVLLDMRGELGHTLTLQGDLHYDLSKVYQSLLGYDFILLGQPLRERDAELLEELRDCFRDFVAEHYPSVRHADVVALTASHYFAIVPLHQVRAHQLAYLSTCHALLSSLPKPQRYSSPPRSGGPSSGA